MKALVDILDDVLYFAGCGCILYGLALWSPIVAWITAGGMLILFGFLLGLGGERNDHS